MANNWLDIQGTQDLARLSRALQEAGEQGKGLRRELSRSLSRETKQTRKDMKAAITPALPKRGGLAADVLGSTRFATSTSLKGPSVGVRIKARGKRSIRRMNATGTFRHPVFGRRDTWVTQSSPGLKGFLDKPFEHDRPDLQRAVYDAIARVNAKITRSI